MRIIYCLLCFSFLLGSCSGLQKSSKRAEDFTSFYQRFHRDSLFQVQRVRFPVNGYAIEGGRISAWTKEDWSMHKNGLEQIDTSVYLTERYERHGIIQERIYQTDSGVLIERHFSKFQNQWFLTFYLYVFL